MFNKLRNIIAVTFFLFKNDKLAVNHNEFSDGSFHLMLVRQCKISEKPREVNERIPVNKENKKRDGFLNIHSKITKLKSIFAALI